MSIFKDHAKDAENELEKEKRVNFWKKLLTVGFLDNEKRVHKAERNLQSCQEDLADSRSLKSEAKDIDDFEESISFHGIRVSKHTFADLRVLGTEGYPAEWEQLRQSVLQRDDFVCQERDGYCEGSLHIHHIIELSKGGSNDQDNLVTLCRYHHSMKHSHMQRD